MGTTRWTFFFCSKNALSASSSGASSGVLGGALLDALQVSGQLLLEERLVEVERRPHHQLTVLLVRDDADVGEGLLVGLGAVPVIPVPVRVDDPLHRLIGDRADLGEHRRRCAGVPLVSNTSTPSREVTTIELPSRPTSP